MKIKRKAALMTLFLICLTLIFPIVVSADCGPHDELEIHVKNPPDELYYLDLLVEGKVKDKPSRHEIIEEERKNLNQDMLDLLYSYEGWIPVHVEGRNYSWGNIIGGGSNEDYVHEFYYMVPDTFRIIIVTESGKVTVSDVCTRYILQGRMTYDYAGGKAVVPQIWRSYLLQFISTCIPTLLIEGILLLVFRFKLKDNWKPFLIINILTQIFLTFTVGMALIRSGTLGAYIMQVPAEVVIIIAETLLFKKYLVGQSESRRANYGVTANLISWLLGYILLGYQFELLLKLL